MISQFERSQMMNTKKQDIYTWSDLIQNQQLRCVGLGVFYVIALIILGQYCSATTSHKNELKHLNAGLRFDRLKSSTDQIRRQSKYAQHINQPTGVLKLWSAHEQCTALLLSERLILTEGNCAQALDFSAYTGQGWMATSQHLPRHVHRKLQSTLEAKIMTSRVHPTHKLAIHLLDRALPYAPIKLLPAPRRTFAWQTEEKPQDIVKTQTRQFGPFVLGRHKNNADIIVLGRSTGQRFSPLLNEERNWITYVKGQLTRPRHKSKVHRHTLALSHYPHTQTMKSSVKAY